MATVCIASTGMRNQIVQYFFKSVIQPFKFHVVPMGNCCVDEQRCPDGRSWGFTMYPDGISEATKDLIRTAQNAKCSDENDLCCAIKYIIPEHPSVHAINEISDKLFKIEPTNFEKMNSSVM